MKYYSQYGQDTYLDKEVFKGKRGGFFVEVGAEDGITFSNTYFFEKEREWNGICIEPRKKAFSQLVKNRKCIPENICVGKENKTEKFLEIEGGNDMLSGIYNKYDSRHIKRIHERKLPGETQSMIEVKCQTLASILQKYNISEIDYLSIDTEGNELDILKGIDFDKVKIRYITVENNYGGSRLRRMKATEVRRFLAKKGFTLVKIMKIDEVYAYTGTVKSGIVEEVKQILTSRNFYK